MIFSNIFLLQVFTLVVLVFCLVNCQDIVEFPQTERIYSYEIINETDFNEIREKRATFYR